MNKKIILTIVIILAVLAALVYFLSDYLKGFLSGSFFFPEKVKTRPTMQEYCDRVDNGRCVLDDFNLLYPKGGETLCIGDTIDIKWNAPDKIEEVNLILMDVKDREKLLYNASYKLGTFPAKDGVYQWKVGDVPEGVLNESDSYDLIINTTLMVEPKYGFLTADFTKELFSIKKCD